MVSFSGRISALTQGCVHRVHRTQTQVSPQLYASTCGSDPVFLPLGSTCPGSPEPAARSAGIGAALISPTWAPAPAFAQGGGAPIKIGFSIAQTGALAGAGRVTQSVRQPGSAIKPLSYLAALGMGLQPNTLVEDEEITLPPIGGGRGRHKDYWTPKNYDGSSGGTITLRRALENSRNLATVRLLDGGIEDKPEASLTRLCNLALEAQIYHECVHYYPFVLGAQPVRPVDLAAFYAAIANEGTRPVPYVVESIERDGELVYRHQPAAIEIASVDHAAFYQLKSMMQGVLAHGTARSIAHLAPFVAGKTGTSDDENDVWFVGFSNDVTVAVWLGYDNSDGKHRTLGSGATGGGVAVPIFEPVMRAVWAHVAPKIALAPPSPEAKRQLSCKSVDRDSDEVQRGGTECFRISANGKIIDTKYRLISRAYAKEDGEDREERPSRRFRHGREEERPSRHHKVYAQSRYLWRGWQPWSWGWPWR